MTVTHTNTLRHTGLFIFLFLLNFLKIETSGTSPHERNSNMFLLLTPSYHSHNFKPYMGTLGLYGFHTFDYRAFTAVFCSLRKFEFLPHPLLILFSKYMLCFLTIYPLVFLFFPPYPYPNGSLSMAINLHIFLIWLNYHKEERIWLHTWLQKMLLKRVHIGSIQTV